MTTSTSRIPALDGVRGVAVLAVFGSHAGVPWFSLGGAGVDVFFVLSGYLITTILLSEVERTGTISLGRFYLRRIKRLTPALLLLVVIYVLIAPFAWSERSMSEHAGLSALSFLYLMDYARAFWIGHNPLVHTWSLAVEEHFYLVWPFVLLAMARWVQMRHWLKALAAAYFAATLWRCVSIDLFGWPPTYFRFDSRLSTLILGSVLAVLLRGETTQRERSLCTLGLVAGGCLIAAFAVRSYAGAEGAGAWATLGIALTEAVSLAVILTIIERHREGTPTLLTRALSGAAIVYVGQISYGLYLFHHPLTYWLYGYHWSVVLAVSLPAALGLAALSYHLIEQPVLRGRAPFWFPGRLAAGFSPGGAGPAQPPDWSKSG